MYKIIDTPWNTTPYIPQLKSGGVETVIRYYNLENSSALPQKQLEPGEADALAAAGFSIAVVFQQTGGAEGRIGNLDAVSGSRDAARALALAGQIRQPQGSAIYFAVDHDYSSGADMRRIKPYFAAVSAALAGIYRVGVYGSGTVGATMRDAGYAELIWLAGSIGWSGTRQMLAGGGWALFQSAMNIAEPLDHDGNIASSAFSDFGQFIPRLAPGGASGEPLLV